MLTPPTARTVSARVINFRCGASAGASNGVHAFPLPSLGARCAFRKETFAGTGSDGEDAPIPAVRGVITEPLESTLSGPTHRAIGARAPVFTARIDQLFRGGHVAPVWPWS